MIRIDEQDWEKRRALLADGWREIEVLETYEGPVLNRAQYRNAFLASNSDIEDLCAMTRLFTHDRLHSDELVPTEEADAAKAEAVRRAFNTGGYIYVYWDPEFDMADGFISVYRKGATMAVDLIVVREHARSRGVAAGLMKHAATKLLADHMQAGTQMRNEPAKKLYESLGMSVVKRERTFHK
jgi:ribosomal protein S18 acetylase RimI-like enzyme